MSPEASSARAPSGRSLSPNAIVARLPQFGGGAPLSIGREHPRRGERAAFLLMQASTAASAHTDRPSARSDLLGPNASAGLRVGTPTRTVPLAGVKRRMRPPSLALLGVVRVVFVGSVASGSSRLLSRCGRRLRGVLAGQQVLD